MARQSRWQRYVDAAVDGPPSAGRGDTRHRVASTTPPRLAGPAQAGEGRARAGTRAGAGRADIRVWLRDRQLAATAPDRSGPEHSGEPARRTDLRLVPAALLAWATAAAGGWLDPGALAVLCAALLAGSGALLLRVAARAGGRTATTESSGRSGSAPRSLLATAAVALLLSAVAGSHAAVASAQRHDADLAGAVAANAPVVAEVVVAGAPRRLSSPGRSGLADRWAVPAMLVAMDWDARRIRAAAGVLVLGGPDWEHALPGERIRTTGKLRPAEPGQIAAAVLSASSAPRTLADPGPLQQGARSLREDLASAAGRFGGDAAGLLPGMVTGDTSSLDPHLESSMKTVGMTHLTAVSGANCSIILGVFLLLARGLRLGRVAAAAVCLAGLGMFVLMVGPDPSVLRAAVMGAIGLVSLVGGRTGGGLSFLCLAVIGLLLTDPGLSTSFGFLLSVLATLGIVVTGRPIMSWLPRAVPRWAAAGLAVPLAAQVFCGPAIVLLQPQFSTYALAANLVASALVPPVTLFGTAAVPLVPISPGLAAAPLAVAAVFAGGVAGIARFFADLPGAVLPWPEGPYGMATMVLFSVAVLTSVWLVLHPAAVVARAVAAQRRTVAILTGLSCGHPGLQGPVGRVQRGLVDRPGRGTLRVCKRTSRRNHEWLLPRPNAPGPPRRSRPPGVM
ncbi:competence protein ComEC [Arthrobacter sp. V4I6]|uniref:ComEC/Rec2 family competence protein n=1 Tax=unclassified Arthrobacter TaxID=235627 RepID=UPI002789811A|nr:MULTISPECIES: ComEC/Rec2 family competence protein [unclassified Arthrobacter]MDQ0820937.1 competence protein ComEC [Arthrobacter sp. V1I7]MDQ0855198.1 competence protein ComEC [Arthrobacter sp. V4I6]